MTTPDWVALIGVTAIAVAVQSAFRFRVVQRIGDFAPEPFWIYFLSIVGGITGVMPAQSVVYTVISTLVLPAAIFLMLVGTPITLLLRLGARASAAMALAAATMVIAMVAAFAAFRHALPEGAWRGAGALLGTWVGGSANMIAVKEILQMPDTDFAPLVIVDTILSYVWLALLLLGPALQSRFDRGAKADATAPAPELSGVRPVLSWRTALPLAVGWAAALLCVAAGRKASALAPVIPSGGWALLLATLVAMGAALTPLRGVEAQGASIVGRWALYVVLASIGAKTRLAAAAAAPVYIAFGAVVLVLHGVLTLALGRLFRLPLFLLSTASQANVGGAVSAPIVAEAYRPGTASIGVLMAVAGVLGGTYVGVVGGYICRWVAQWMG
jgi:uncharacterized membrane protein